MKLVPRGRTVLGVLLAVLLLGGLLGYLYLDRRWQATRHIGRGLTAYKARDWQEAAGAFSEAVRVAPPFSPEKAQAHTWRGNARGELLEYDGAIDDFDEAIRLDPKNALAYRGRGIAWGQKGEHERALTDFGEAIRLGPDDALALYNRGVVHAKSGAYDLAIADFGEAIRLNPNYAKAYLARSKVHGKKGAGAQAQSDREKAVVLDPALGEPGGDR
jgi:tetratricopeptide (TPR) repeat protein